jgi:hypothetical protein
MRFFLAERAAIDRLSFLKMLHHLEGFVLKTQFGVFRSLLKIDFFCFYQ